MSDYFLCPHCGTDVPRGAKSCPLCGSDEKTGWSEFTYMDGLGLPDDDEYNELRQQEFSEHKGINKIWIIVTAAFLLLGISLMILNSVF